MKTLTYSERSRMPAWVFVLLAVQTAVVMLVALKSGDARALPWIILIIFPVGLLLGTAGIRLRFTPESLYYKGTPFPLKSREIKWEDMESIAIIKIDPLTEFLGWGYKKSLKYGWGHIYDGNDALFITLKNGKKVTFTLKNKEEAIRFLTENNIPYTH